MMENESQNMNEKQRQDKDLPLAFCVFLEPLYLERRFGSEIYQQAEEINDSIVGGGSEGLVREIEGKSDVSNLFPDLEAARRALERCGSIEEMIQLVRTFVPLSNKEIVDLKKQATDYLKNSKNWKK